MFPFLFICSFCIWCKWVHLWLFPACCLPCPCLSALSKTLVLAPLKLRSLQVRHQGHERRKAASCPDLPAVSVLGYCRERAINHISPVYIIICNCFLNHSDPTACCSLRLLVLQGKEMHRRLGVPRNLLSFLKAARPSQNPSWSFLIPRESQGLMLSPSSSKWWQKCLGTVTRRERIAPCHQKETRCIYHTHIQKQDFVSSRRGEATLTLFRRIFRSGKAP